MKIMKLEVGRLCTNCYIPFCERTKECIVIDPGGSENAIMAAIEENDLTVKYIVDTHAHWDHIGANVAINEATQAPICIHPLDAPALIDDELNFSTSFTRDPKQHPADILLNEGDEVKFGDISLKVIHTPGHTPGGISLYTPGHLFAGDTLFQTSIGRTDFTGGSFKDIIASIKDKLLIYPDDTAVYPGHGPATLIGYEKKHNSFLI